MAENGKNGNGRMSGNVCTCPACMYGSGGRHWTFFLLRTILTILILMIVFWFGVAAGRLGDRGGSYMRGYAYPVDSMGSGGAMPMMPIRDATSTPTTGGVQNY